MEKNSDIKIVVTDYNMPNMNGVDFMKIIRRVHSKDSISVIGVSTDLDSSTQFLKNGANDFIKKPFSKEEFVCRVNNSVEALDNIQKIEEMANIDYLTKISNRKYFFQKAELYHKVLNNDNKSYAIAMIDIDNFKSVNDTYGHGIGDDVIKNLAALLKDNIKGQDIVARFGGEEFVLFLQDIPPMASSGFLNSICKKVENFSINVSETKQINFTVSVGLATDRFDSLDEKINRADELLYIAKNSGKNRVADDLVKEAIPA
jgi:diguanylate cyclase (GGDEF)-like protein